MKRKFPILLIVLGALLIIDTRTGAEATSEFENLHGKQFPLTSGAIGIYDNQQITLWAAATASDSIASQMVESMREKIAEGNSPFTPLTQIAGPIAGVFT